MLRPLPALLCLGLGLLAVTGCLSPGRKDAGAAPLRPTHATLAAALAAADRVEVAFTHAEPGQPPLLQLQGREPVADFVASVRVDDLAGGHRCRCGLGHQVRFFRGGQLAAELHVRSATHVAWIDGPWASDATFEGEKRRVFTDWFTRHGGNNNQLFPRVPDAATQAILAQRAARSADFIPSFPAAAQGLAAASGPMSTSGFDPRRENSNLRELVPDSVTLAVAAFRAFGVHPAPWLEDDYRTAAIQAAVETIPVADLVQAFRQVSTDNRALAGAARIFLRLGMQRKFTAEFNGEWIPKVGRAVLQAGEQRDKAVMLVYLAATAEPAAIAFLREIAGGNSGLGWDVPCDPYLILVHEPSLAASAAVLLALHGESVSPARVTDSPQPELDALARHLAVALADPNEPLDPATLRAPSHILAYAGAEALLRQDPAKISAAAVAAALAHDDTWVVRRVRPLAQRLGVARYSEHGEVNLFEAPVNQSLATQNPAEAIRQCTQQLETTRGRLRAALLVIRGLAHENLGQGDLAIADYEAALKLGNYAPEALHKKLAWLKFYAGRFADAATNVEYGIQYGPSAELYFLRGIAAYVADNFGPGTEADFTTTAGLAPGHGYATIFQHLTCVLGGHPELSRLRVGPREWSPAALTVLSVSPTSVEVKSGVPPTPPWPAAIIGFLRGDVTAENLLALAAANMGEQCEAHYYISQQARAERRPEAERAALQHAVATNASDVVELQLAQLRLSRLR